MRTAPVITAVVAALCSAQAALAQDVQYPAVPFYDWTRVYVGANIGYGSATINDTTTSAGVSTSSSQQMCGRHESKHLQRYAHCENVLVRDGAARICLRPDSLLRDRRRRIRPVLQFGHH